MLFFPPYFSFLLSNITILYHQSINHSRRLFIHLILLQHSIYHFIFYDDFRQLLQYFNFYFVWHKRVRRRSEETKRFAWPWRSRKKHEKDKDQRRCHATVNTTFSYQATWSLPWIWWIFFRCTVSAIIVAILCVIIEARFVLTLQEMIECGR